MISKEEAFKTISQLIGRFEEQFDSYKKSGYNETLTRKDFIDPFFSALGWDMNNAQGFAEAYREVIHEDKIKISGAVKAPDYSFRLSGGKRLFFVEAKKPSVDVKDEIIPAYQIRRYGWSAKLPISIITDFEEFAVYDCTKKPLPADKASVARIRYITFRDYLKEFDFIYDTFSKEKVLKGSFDKFVASTANKKGTTTVDKEFLQSLDEWRTYLATSISWNNKELDEDEINFVVQQTIDRLIFLRIAEDRSVEPYGNLKHSISQGDYYKNLFHIFEKADEKYNSGIFDFKKDKISKGIKVDNKVIKTIINELYYPESPYEFSVLSVEILGNAYEQFLGKQIRIDSAHRARIEEKPEVRKAGGVYYTPQYIVEYIVKNTIGKLIDGKTPKEISDITIADIACGSGSFLLGAYQYLLDYHKDYYTRNGTASKGKKDNPLTPEGHLTTAEKKRILLNNIYGVDIDVNAVEVTKLSLLLKCMEGETEASIASQMSLWHERVLPSLENNIKSGNSLVDVDYYEGKFDFGDEKITKPFNWEKGFPNVFKNNGFDVVIGNPPYVRQELIGEQKKYYQNKYAVYNKSADLYSYFIERGISLLNKNGIFGIIVANKWMRSNYGHPLRVWIKKYGLHQIIDFGDLQVFENATTYPCILICRNNKTSQNIEAITINTLKFESLESFVKQNSFKITKENLDDGGWSLSPENERSLNEKLFKNTIPLEEYVGKSIFRGILTGLDEAFVLTEEEMKSITKNDKKSKEIIREYKAGKDVKKYFFSDNKRFLIFMPKGFTNSRGKNPKKPWAWLLETYPGVANHLEQFKSKAEKRYDKGDYWWELRACDYYDEFSKPKITYLKFQVHPAFAFDTEGIIANSACFIIPTEDKFLLGLLNSKLGWYLISSTCTRIQNGYQLIWDYFKKFPIRPISSNNKKHLEIKDQVTKSVERIISLHVECNSSQLNSKKESIFSEINWHENKIEESIFKLYELTPDEINIIDMKKE